MLIKRFLKKYLNFTHCLVDLEGGNACDKITSKYLEFLYFILFIFIYLNASILSFSFFWHVYYYYFI